MSPDMRVESASGANARPEFRAPLVDLLYQLADDELALGHRDSEYLGLAPHIEEDVAFSSIAQDEVGHANLFFQFLAELGEGRPDDLAFLRPAAERRNAVLLERPNGSGTYLENPRYDWAFVLARHILYDRFDALRLEACVRSAYLPLAQAAVKIRREEHYHLRHGETWLRRLAGAPEARRRFLRGLEQAWADAADLFDFGPAGHDLAALGILPATPEQVQADWTRDLQAMFAATGVPWPGALPAPAGAGRRGRHTADLPPMLDTMAAVYRLDPAASW